MAFGSRAADETGIRYALTRATHLRPQTQRSQLSCLFLERTLLNDELCYVSVRCRSQVDEENT